MFAKPPVLDNKTQLSRDEIIERWIDQAATSSGNERRRFRRFPFFQPIKISSDFETKRCVSAFTRDISRHAIGLVHSEPISRGRMTLQLSRPKLEVTVDIKRCETYHSWCVSHGLFVGLSATQFAKLAFATATQSVSLRLAQRYPFFRPVKLTQLPNLTRVPAVFSRDISSTGIGLFHNTPLENHQVLIRTQSDDDPHQAVQAKIRWCRSCDNGWYVSGASFDKIMIEQLEF